MDHVSKATPKLLSLLKESGWDKTLEKVYGNGAKQIMAAEDKAIMEELSLIAQSAKYFCRNCGFIYDKYKFDRSPGSILKLEGTVCGNCGWIMEQVIPPTEFREYHDRKLTKEEIVELLI